MRRIDLQEYAKSPGVPLSASELRGLLAAARTLGLAVAPTSEAEGLYDVTPSSTVGAIELGDLSLLITPKIGVPQLLSLACYTTGQIKLQREDFNFRENIELPEVLARALHAQARRAFAAGLLHGYRTEEEALYGVRGRIRFDDQLRRRFGMAVPVEVRYDEFTDDILANQLVKAAVVMLGRMRLRSQPARVGLGWVAAMLDNVTLVEFPANDVPDVSFDRLNEHYKGVIALSRLVLQNSAFQSNRGGVRAQGFLMDMNKVFQEFVTVALREELGLSSQVFCSDREIPQRTTLDEARKIGLEPDLSWWQGKVCRFVGDAKYKRMVNEHVPNADLYQLLAYATALRLPGGMLIYAKNSEETAEHTPELAVHKVVNTDKRLIVAALDLSGDLDEVLRRVGRIANRVRDLAVSEERGFPPSRE